MWKLVLRSGGALRPARWAVSISTIFNALRSIAWKLSERMAHYAGTTRMVFYIFTGCPALLAHTPISRQLPLSKAFFHPKVLNGINFSWRKCAIFSKSLVGSRNRFVHLRMGFGPYSWH